MGVPIREPAQYRVARPADRAVELAGLFCGQRRGGELPSAASTRPSHHWVRRKKGALLPPAKPTPTSHACRPWTPSIIFPMILCLIECEVHHLLFKLHHCYTCINMMGKLPGLSSRFSDSGQAQLP